MSDKTKNFITPAPKTFKSKRPSTVSISATSSRVKVPSTAQKEKVPVSRPKINKNVTLAGDLDNTVMKLDSSGDFDAEHRQVAYGKFLRAMLEDCIVDEKIEREETQIDIQMSQLADRFQKTIGQLDKTNKRLKDISFVVEQHRLLDLKSNGSDQFYKMTESSDVEQIMKDLSHAERESLDRLHLKNVDFGINKESGHKKLLDAVNDAIEGLDEIKKHSKLDIEKLKEYEKSQMSIEDLAKERYDLESLKSEFESKFPNYGERLMKEASEMISKMMNDEFEEDSDDD